MAAGFRQHLRDAIRVNRERGRYYARLTNNRSYALSRRLIWSEKLCLLPAAWFDWQANRFNEYGIDIVRGDFVGMDDLPAPDTAPRFTGTADHDAVRAVRQCLREFQACARALTAHSDTCLAFTPAVQRTIARLVAIETGTQAHFALSHHLVRSIGYAATNAVEYAQASNEQTWPLSRWLIHFQCLGLQGGVGLDVRAQALHRMNVGILVNDLPAIPFAPNKRR